MLDTVCAWIAVITLTWIVWEIAMKPLFIMLKGAIDATDV